MQKMFATNWQTIIHTCIHRDSTVQKNVMAMVTQLPDKQTQHAASSIIKNVFKDQSESRNSIALSTAGRPKNIYFESSEYEDMSFSHDQLDEFQVMTGSSKNLMRKFTTLIRSTAERKSIHVKYEAHIKEKSELLDKFYQTECFKFETANGKIEERPVVWENTSQLLDEIVDRRTLVGN